MSGLINSTGSKSGIIGETELDYEEGTWTPTVYFGSTQAGGYGTQSGGYVKIGNTVTITGLLTLSSKGAGSGSASIRGLPFTCKSGSNHYSASSCYLNKVTFADHPLFAVDVGTTNILVQEVTNGGTRTDIVNTDFSNDSEVFFGLTYISS